MIGGARERIDEIIRFKSNMDSGMFYPLQAAAAKALSLGDDWYRELNALYRRREAKAYEILDAVGCTYDPVQAGLFVSGTAPRGSRRNCRRVFGQGIERLRRVPDARRHFRLGGRPLHPHQPLRNGGSAATRGRPNKRNGIMKAAIVGVGLIGGSFALTLKDNGIADEVIGVDNSERNRAKALELGLVDRTASLAEAVAGADLVVLATPVDSIPAAGR